MFSCAESCLSANLTELIVAFIIMIYEVAVKAQLHKMTFSITGTVGSYIKALGEFLIRTPSLWLKNIKKKYVNSEHALSIASDRKICFILGPCWYDSPNAVPQSLFWATLQISSNILAGVIHLISIFFGLLATLQINSHAMLVLVYLICIANNCCVLFSSVDSCSVEDHLLRGDIPLLILQ